MGITDKAKELREKVAKSGKADEYIDKAKEKADQATGGRFGDTLDKGADRAKDAASKPRDEEQGADMQARRLESGQLEDDA